VCPQDDAVAQRVAAGDAKLELRGAGIATAASRQGATQRSDRCRGSGLDQKVASVVLICHVDLPVEWDAGF